MIEVHATALPWQLSPGQQFVHYSVRFIDPLALAIPSLCIAIAIRLAEPEPALIFAAFCEPCTHAPNSYMFHVPKCSTCRSLTQASIYEHNDLLYVLGSELAGNCGHPVRCMRVGQARERKEQLGMPELVTKGA